MQSLANLKDGGFYQIRYYYLLFMLSLRSFVVSDSETFDFDLIHGPRYMDSASQDAALEAVGVELVRRDDTRDSHRRTKLSQARGGRTDIGMATHVGETRKS